MFTYQHVGEYLRFWKECRAILDRGLKVRVCRFPEEILDRAGFARWMQAALDRRINAKAGLDAPRGKKDNTDFFIAARRDKERLLAIRRRIRVYQFETPITRARFGHLLADPRET